MLRDIGMLVLAALVLGIGALIPNQPAPTSLEPQPAASLAALVRPSTVFSLSNQERKDEGVPQLSLNPLLMRAAQLKAEDMAEEAYYAHVSPQGETPMHWLDTVGYKYQYVGENLTANILDEGEVVSAWMGSPGHRRNLLDPKFTQMGVGVAEGTYKGREALFVVQMLATPKPVQTPPAPKPVTVAAKPPAPVPTPAPKPVATPKPPAPKPITESKIVKDVQELTKPIIDPLTATSTLRIFTATGTDPIPFVISTSAIPVELRAATTSDLLPAPSEPAYQAGKQAGRSFFTQIGYFVSNIRSFIGM